MGFLYYKLYSCRFKTLFKDLYKLSVDVELLKEFHEFLKLTSIHEIDKFKEKYIINLYSDKNTIKFRISTDIFFTISVFMDNKLSIDYTDGEVFRYLFDIENNILNFDQRDQRRYEVLSDINRKIIDIVIFSILLYLEYDRKG